MASKSPQIPQHPQTVNGPQTATIHPTPPAFSSHAFESNDIAAKTAKITCENKQLTPQNLLENDRFATGMQKFFTAEDSPLAKATIGWSAMRNTIRSCVSSISKGPIMFHSSFSAFIKF